MALVEDHVLMSAALSAALEAEGLRTVAPRPVALDEVREELCRLGPSVALVDLDLGEAGRGTSLVAPLSALGCRVVIVSGTSDEWAVGQCLELGAVGWVPKTADLDRLVSVVWAALVGQPVTAEVEQTRLLEAWEVHRVERDRALAPFGSLSRAEVRVLAMLVDGTSAERIAEAGYVSVATVRTQIRSVLSKLGVNSQLEAAALAHRVGWVPTETPDG